MKQIYNRAPVSAPQGSNPWYSSAQLSWAKNYWKNLTDQELHEFHTHYTLGAGKNHITGVIETTTFEEYLVLSALQSNYEIAHNC